MSVVNRLTIIFLDQVRVSVSVIRQLAIHRYLPALAPLAVLI